jgi:hypothetical protein
LNKYFPQAGILTSLNKEEAMAKVMIPLLQHETEWCPVVTNLLYEKEIEEENIESDDPTIYANIPKTVVVVSGPKGTESKRKVQREKYGTLQVGDEVLVIFLNGDIHQPVVAGRL